MFNEIDQYKAGGINLLYFVAASLPATIGHAKNKLINHTAAIYAIISGLPLCILFSYIASIVDNAVLKKIFGVILLIVGIREMFVKAPKEET